jgi:hypothetical protein
VVEGARFEIVWAAMSREFESPLLRHFKLYLKFGSGREFFRRHFLINLSASAMLCFPVSRAKLKGKHLSLRLSWLFPYK